MITAVAVPTNNEASLRFVSASAGQSAETAIGGVFADPARPALTRVDTVRYSSDAIEAPVSTAPGWPNGKYITFSRYVDSANPSAPVHYNVSGTGPNGEYIPPHQVDERGRVTMNAGPPNEFKIHAEQKMVGLLDLKSAGSDNNGRAYYTREGFSGRYYLQTEQDGQVSVHYSGGAHTSGVSLPPQTFVNGRWDLTRRESISSPGSLSLPGPLVSAPAAARPRRV